MNDPYKGGVTQMPIALPDPIFDDDARRRMGARNRSNPRLQRVNSSRYQTVPLVIYINHFSSVFRRVVKLLSKLDRWHAC